MPSLNLTLKEGGWVWIAPQAKTSDAFQFVLDKIKKVPVITFDKKVKKFVTSIYYLDDLFEICRLNGWTAYVSDLLDEYHQRFKSRLLLIAKARQDTTFSSELWNPEFTIDPHQAQAVNVAFFAKRWLIGDDMGVGKTIELIGIICRAFDNDYNKALIVVMNRLKYQWRNEILKFTKLKPEDVSVVDPAAKFTCPLKITDTLNLRSMPCRACDRKTKCTAERSDPIKKAKSQLDNCKIAIVNYESLDRIKEIVVDMEFDVFGFDEASKMKNHQSKMAKAAKFIGSKCPSYSIITLMSGTFIENVCYDIFSSLRTIDARIVGEWYNFKNRFLVTDFWNKVIGFRRKKQLRQIIDDVIIRRELKEVWKGPPLKEYVRMCDMGEVQARVYRDAKEGKLKELADLEQQNKINMADIGALLNYLIQIADTPETMDPKIKKESCKIDTLKELIEFEIAKDRKILIFSFFGNKVVPIINREVTSLKMGKTIVITGKTKLKDAEEKIALFKRNKSYRFLICSDALSYGQNIQEASVVINFDLPWNPAKLNQRIARSFRRGQTRKVLVYNLASTGTIDEGILEKLGEKRKLFNDLLGNKSTKSNFSLKDMLALLKA